MTPSRDIIWYNVFFSTILFILNRLLLDLNTIVFQTFYLFYIWKSSFIAHLHIFKAMPVFLISMFDYCIDTYLCIYLVSMLPLLSYFIKKTQF